MEDIKSKYSAIKAEKSIESKEKMMNELIELVNKIRIDNRDDPLKDMYYKKLSILLNYNTHVDTKIKLIENLI